MSMSYRMTRYAHDFDKIQGLPGDEEERLLDNEYNVTDLTNYTSIAAYHTQRIRLLNMIFLFVHLGAIALGIIAILMFNSIRLIFPVASIGVSVIFVLMAVFYSRFQEDEVGVLLGSSWLLKSPGAKYIRWFILWNFVFTFFLIGFLYDWFILVPATEYLGWSVFSLFGCSNPQCGINPNCPAILNDAPSTFWNNPYEMDPKTLPPIDRDDSIDDKRKRGPCVCMYQEDVTEIPRNITFCVPEQYFVSTDFIAANSQAVYDTLDTSQQGPDPGMYCSALFCPEVGEINPRNANEYTGELMYWNKPLVILYIFLQPILLVLFIIEVLFYGLWALSVLEYEKMLREEELNAKRKINGNAGVKPGMSYGNYTDPYYANMPPPRMAIDTVIRNRLGVPPRLANAINQGKQRISSLRNPSPPPPPPVTPSSSNRQPTKPALPTIPRASARRTASTSPSRARNSNTSATGQRTTRGNSSPQNRSRSQSPPPSSSKAKQTSNTRSSRSPSPPPIAKQKQQGFYDKMYSK